MKKNTNSTANLGYYIVFTLLIVPLLFTLVSCKGSQQKSTMQGVPVKAIKLQKKKLESTSDYVAKLFSRKSTSLYPRVNGPISSINVKEGDFVKKGTVLVTIESSKQAASVSASKAQADSALNDAKQAKATLKSILADNEAYASAYELKKIEYDRYKTLYDKKSATQSDLDTATNDLNQAKAQLVSQQEQLLAQEQLLKSKESVYKQAIENSKQEQINYDYYKISAPFDGKIGSIPVSIGEYVTSSTELVSVTENTDLEVEIYVDSSNKDKLKEGLKVKVLNQTSGKLNEATVYFVSPRVDPETQTILIKAILDNSNGTFNPDEIVKTTVVWNLYDGLVIPTESVVHFSGQDFVFLIKQGDKGSVVDQVAVTLGEIQDNNYVLIDGLKENDTIVLAGVQKLRDGVPVVIQK